MHEHSTSSRRPRSFPLRWKYNDYRVEPGLAYLILRDGEGRLEGEAIIDIDNLDRVLNVAHWGIVTPRKDKNLSYVSGQERGERERGVKRQRLYLHRVIMGVTDPALMVDHENGNGLDCRRENMRITDNSGNQKNQYRHRRIRALETTIAGLHAEIERLNALVVTLRNP